ncbi:sodium:solute symporter family protein [Acinetobacter indicus]|uniref:sodium:solute symporter family protein n=1 Tax=Acinetobacter indicus TaxID=756892 RepID=UPI000CEC2FE5|nr:sodium:solute symporter family protein [Acinetobacter indicus]MDM1263209.1 sodium:solute symporter family protein [Acinetobacter indicus]
MFQFTSTTTVLLMVLFYGITFLLSLRIKQKNENVDGYMVSNGSIGFGMSAASMTATWIWAASFYAAASSGYKYGVSGALHYGLWGALMILFIYPFGKRFRELAPNAHTLAEIMHARHGNQSQMILAGSNIVGSVISLMVNFTAAGALVEILSPLSFVHGVLITGIGVLSYTLWSGFRSSVFTDFGQLVAMIVAAVIIIPTLFFTLGGPSLFQTGIHNLQPEQLDFFSKTAFLEQGAPFFVAVLAYAIGNQTIAQRLFAVREDLIKPSFITATIGYAAIVIGLGMLGLLALFAGIQPIDGNLNNLIPQMAATYLSPFMVALLFIMVIGALSSTADSDLSALSAIVMTDIYGKQIAKNQPNPKKMLFIGRMTMIVATMLGIIIATLKFDILSMLIFVGALWGSIVFPVIVSLYWDKVNARAFNWSVGIAFASFLIVRFEWIPIQGLIALGFELVATLGIGVVLGLMTFGFFGKKVGLVVGILASIGFMPWTIGFLREYGTLLSSLTAYGSSALVCTVLTLVYSKERFDFKQINKMVIEFHQLSEKSK